MSDASYQIRSETASDFAGIRRLYLEILGEDEARLVEWLREDRAFTPEMSRVASADGIVIGHALFSDLKIAGRRGNKIKGAALAPVGVLAQVQKMGIGSALIEGGLDIVRGLGYEVAVVLGDEGYYSRFGFSVELASKIQCPYSGKHLMALELKTGVLADEKKVAAVYPQAFARLKQE